MSNQSFRHILVIEDRKSCRIVALDRPIYTIGRADSNNIVIHDRSASRRHGTLLRIEPGVTPGAGTATEREQLPPPYYRIIDGDLAGNYSTNGLLVNDRHYTSYDLKHGDVILLGKIKASYYILAESAEIPLFNSPSPNFNDEPITQLGLADELAKATLHEEEQTTEADPENLRRLASFPQLSPYPIVEIDFSGEITYLNQSARLKFGDLSAEKLVNPVLAELLVNDYRERGQLVTREITVGPEIFEQYVHYLPEQGRIRSYLFDVTERKQVERKLAYQAFHDSLTDLPNRTCFNNQLAIALANAKRYGEKLAVMFLDLDNFKNVNNTLGHDIGDQLLRGFAQRLNACLRAGDMIARLDDTLARWGGDEFILLLPRIQKAEDTIKLAERIFQSLKHPFDLPERQLYVNSSIGIALYPQDGEDGPTLIRNADTALFQAKEEGRNCYRFYSAAMTSKAAQLLNLENRLHQALDNQQFSLYYQPQMRLATGEISGMEALLRCSHPELKQIPIADLISLAERTDLILPLSEWVLRTACQQNKLWQEAGLTPIPIAVNFSPRQFQQENLAARVEQVLAQTKLAPQWLEVEITETSIMENAGIARGTLDELRQLGVLLSMDDFGTGYSSLRYLQQFPFHTLKIDRSFVLGLSDSQQNRAIVSAAIALGRSFNLRVVAEGVETLQHLELLQGLQCDEIQGYWFSYPLKEAAATEFLSQHGRIL